MIKNTTKISVHIININIFLILIIRNSWLFLQNSMTKRLILLKLPLICWFKRIIVANITKNEIFIEFNLILYQKLFSIIKIY